MWELLVQGTLKAKGSADFEVVKALLKFALTRCYNTLDKTLEAHSLGNYGYDGVTNTGACVLVGGTGACPSLDQARGVLGRESSLYITL